MEINSIDSYIDRALEFGRIKSDRALCKVLGTSSAVVTQWRTKRTWPSEKSMLLLADLARIDRQKALADLHFWSAETPEVRQVWQQVRDQLAA